MKTPTTKCASQTHVNVLDGRVQRLQLDDLHRHFPALKNTLFYTHGTVHACQRTLGTRTTTKSNLAWNRVTTNMEVVRDHAVAKLDRHAVQHIVQDMLTSLMILPSS